MISLYSKSKKKTKKGFTLVEMLVAVAILVSATVGPIVLASQGIGVATEAKNRILAAYLADEVVEFVKNKRDTNVLSGDSWLLGLENCASGPCRLDVWTNEIAPCSGNECLMYTTVVSSSFIQEARFGHVGNETGARFRRSFQYELTSSDEMKLTVRVEWQEKLRNKNIELVSYLYKWN